MPALTDTLDAPLEELLDARGATTLLKSFFGLFRIPARILSESGAVLARSGDEPELHRHLGQNAKTAALLGKFFEELRALELGESGEQSLRSFTGASYHIVAIGHGGRRIGRAVIGPFVESGLSLSRFHQALEGVVDTETCNRLASELPRAKTETVRSIGRHLVTTLGLLLHESHQALLSARMHLAAMKETQRETQRRQHLATVEQEKCLQTAQARCAVVAEVVRELQPCVEALVRDPKTNVFAQSTGARPEAGLRVKRLCDGLVEMASLDAVSSCVRVETCTIETLTGALTSAFSDQEFEVPVEAESELPALQVDTRALGRSVRHLAQRARALGSGEPAFSVELRRVRMESTEVNVGALMFLEPSKGSEVELRLEFLFGSNETFSTVASALAQGASAREQGVELEVTIARRLIEAQGGTVSLQLPHSGKGCFSLLLPCH